MKLDELRIKLWEVVGNNNQMGIKINELFLKYEQSNKSEEFKFEGFDVNGKPILEKLEPQHSPFTLIDDLKKEIEGMKKELKAQLEVMSASKRDTDRQFETFKKIIFDFQQILINDKKETIVSDPKQEKYIYKDGFIQEYDLTNNRYFTLYPSDIVSKLNQVEGK